ncbi:MAG TPA: cytochrome bc complex cytochrome b subunit [Actinomycetaceae bacterium]|nr:cytochrome bc complex cytochrome b subunit [Actinomycetaceae bacterium]
MSTATTPKKPLQPSGESKTTPGKSADWLDQRTGIAKVVKVFARKVFPDHWSFLLGEIALYSFIVILLSGVFLAFFFEPSMAEVHYPDDALPVTMQGVEMSAAYASTLKLSFHVPGGLLMRQIHHWAALLFIASIVVHMFRVFFTGAFRKPREINYLVGFMMLLLALAAGLTGYSLPDDVLSGNGLRITDGVIKSIPILGSYVSLALFGGEFPGTDIISRFFALHILLIPGLILALVTLHIMLVTLQKHTHYPGPGRTNRNVVGRPLFPVYAAKGGGWFFIVAGVIVLMGALLSINAVWNYGPYDPSPVSAGAQPDWYMLFLEGGLRLMPGWEVVIAGYTLSLNVLIPALIIPGALFTALGAYPFIEKLASKDDREHHLLERPRNNPTRTAIGVSLITAFAVLVAAGANDLLATHLHLDMFVITWVLRFGFFLFPWFAFMLTKRIAISLQRRDRELVLHGVPTGRVVQTEDGAMHAVHRPLDEYELWTLASYEPNRPLESGIEVNKYGVERRTGVAPWRRRLSQFFYEDRIEPVTPAELEAMEHRHHEGAPSQSIARLTSVTAGEELEERRRR